MSLHFSDLLLAAGGDTTATHDISRHFISRRHRSRRQRRQRRNIIGFFQEGEAHANDDTSDSDEGELRMEGADAELSGSVPGDSRTASLFAGASQVQAGMLGRLDKMSLELDGLVKFIRRSTENLASGAGDAAPMFGILAFALEDWDM
jgi:gamma-tubulin complex component 5